MPSIILIFIAGLFLLLQGAHYLVDGSVNIARRFKVSRLVIGLTVLAIGTSAPEFVTSVVAALHGESDLLFSNISGSNIMNILLMLGLTALITQIPVQRKFITREFPYMLLSSLCFFIMLFDARTFGAGTLYRPEGIILLSLFVVYTIHIIRESRQVNSNAEQDKAEGTVLKNAAFILIGLTGLVLGAQLIVEASVAIANVFGISKTFIGVVVIALGTSLPEIASSIVAARRNETDLAIGNAVGSNIFNILVVIGTSSIIAKEPLTASFDNLVDVGVVFGVTLLLCVLLFIRNKRQKQYVITRFEGGVLLVVFVVYLAYIVVRR